MLSLAEFQVGSINNHKPDRIVRKKIIKKKDLAVKNAGSLFIRELRRTPPLLRRICGVGGG